METLASTCATAVLGVWGTIHQLLRTESWSRLARCDCIVGLERLYGRKCPARPASTLFFDRRHHSVLLTPIQTVRIVPLTQSRLMDSHEVRVVQLRQTTHSQFLEFVGSVV